MKKTKQLLAFVLAFVVAFANVSSVYAGYEESEVAIDGLEEHTHSEDTKSGLVADGYYVWPDTDFDMVTTPSALDFAILQDVVYAYDGSWSFDGAILTVKNGASIELTTNGIQTHHRIVVEAGLTNITLNNVIISELEDLQSPISLQYGANLTLTIEGNNVLTAGENATGINVPMGTSLAIDGNGSLVVNGSNSSIGTAGSNVNIYSTANVYVNIAGADSLARFIQQPQSVTILAEENAGYLFVGYDISISNVYGLQWFQNGLPISGTNSTYLAVPEELEVGEHYFYVEMMVVGNPGFVVRSDMAVVSIVKEMLEILPSDLVPLDAFTSDVQVATEQDLRNAINSAPVNTQRVIELIADINLTGTNLDIPSNRNIVLMGGYTLYGVPDAGSGIGAVITVNGTLTLDGITVTHPPGASTVRGGINIRGLLTMKNGSIEGNSFGVDIEQWTSIFVMYDGTIRNNSPSGGVNNNGTFTMRGGTIADNMNSAWGTMAGGGGVHNSRTFTMYGGSITGNMNYDGNGSGGGGGVNNHSIFTMYGGLIEGNFAPIGGGVLNLSTLSVQWVTPAIFSMYDGVITGNTAVFGGGVVSNPFFAGGGWIHDDSFTFNGGSIVNNIATGDGGGLAIYWGEFDNLYISDTVDISGNIASSTFALTTADVDYLANIGFSPTIIALFNNQQIFYYAGRVAQPYTVDFTAGSNGNITATTNNIAILESPVGIERYSTIVFTAVPDANYRVSSWFVNGNLQVGNDSTTFTINSLIEDTDVHVTFELITHAPAITSGNSISVVHGTGGTFQVLSTGTTPITYSLNGEPIGVSINSATGLITIAPTTAIGTHEFTITVNNVVGNSLPQTFTLVVTAAPVAPGIISTNSTSVVHGTGGTFQVLSSGTTPITYSLNGEPVGVSINSATGLITIASTTAIGTHEFTITANNVVGNSLPQTFTLVVTAAPVAPSITSANSTSVVHGTSGTFQVLSSGTTPITYSLNGEPIGVSINSATGLITIAPTTAIGTHEFTITVSNVVGNSLPQTFTLVVTAAPVAPSITSANSTSVVHGTSGTFQVLSTGTTPITYSINDEPVGVSINSATGLITIAPTTAIGTHEFTITANNVVGNSLPQTFTLVVTAAPVAPSITSANSTSVVHGTSGTFQVLSTGTTPITYSINGEPVGVSINNATGLITIAPTTAIGTHEFAITVSNVVGNSLPQTFTLIVTAAPVAPSITSANSTSVVHGTGGTFQVLSTGTTPITYALNGEPVGVSINNATGLITIMPAIASGTHTFTITASNIAGASTPQYFTLIVNTEENNNNGGVETPPPPPPPPPPSNIGSGGTSVGSTHTTRNAPRIPRTPRRSRLIPVVESARIIGETLSQMEENATDSLAIFDLGTWYIGAEIASHDLLALAEARGALLLTKGRFSAYITYEHINAWGIEEGEIITLLLEPFSPNIAERVSNSIIQRNELNEWWLSEIHIFAVLKDGEYVNISGTPVNINVYLADLQLSDELSYRLVGFIFDEDLQNYLLLNGVLSVNGDTFIFQAHETGFYGVMVGDEKIIYSEPEIVPVFPVVEPIPEPIPSTILRFVIGEFEYTINGLTITNDVAPFIDVVNSQNHRAMLPLRALAEGLGMEVYWVEETRTVFISTGTAQLVLPLDVPLPNDMGMPAMVNERIFVPARYVVEQLGAYTYWNIESMAVYIHQ